MLVLKLILNFPMICLQIILNCDCVPDMVNNLMFHLRQTCKACYDK